MVNTANPDLKNAFLVYFPNAKGPLRYVMIFSTSIDPLKFLATVIFTKMMISLILEVFKVLHE